MIRFYTLQRFVHFSPQDSIASVGFSHYMMFEKRMTETQSFRNINSLLRVDHTKPTKPTTCWSTSSRASRNLLNYARAHNKDSIASVGFSHYMMFEKRMTETQSFRNINSLLRVDHTKPTKPTTCWSTSSRASRNLLNYARAHNSLWLHMEVSSMNNLSSLWAWVAVHRKITRVLRDFQKNTGNTGYSRCVNPPSCLIKLPP